MLKNKYNVKIVGEKKIINQKLKLEEVLNLAKNIYDDKNIFVAFKKEKQNSDDFWENPLIKELSKQENLYFTDLDFIKNLTKDNAKISTEIIKETLNKTNKNNKLGLFLIHEDLKDVIEPPINNIGADWSDNEDLYDQDESSSDLEFNFEHARKNEDIKDVLNKDTIDFQLDREDKSKTQYTKKEFLIKLKHFENINKTIYKMLVKTFGTINRTENKNGYFGIPVGIVPRPQNDRGIFNKNEDTYFFSVIDKKGMVIYQDSIKIGTNILLSQDIYESLGHMVLILINGYETIDHKPVDKLCEILDIPLYYNKNKNLFYKKYIEKITDC